MADRPFLDTNVVLYAFRKGDPRSQIAEALLAQGGTISVQVLNEFVAVARRKLIQSWKEVRRALDTVLVFCPKPIPLTIETHERALQISERWGYSIYDSLIIAAALDSGARTLYSEDMRDGQTIAGLTIRNPFLHQ
jgi:predicted nucleic acid-binding protein